MRKITWFQIIILCATLGMAPFVPEPHLFGKIRWVLGGANGMQFADWFDLIFHGSPFILLLVKIAWTLKSQSR